MTRARGQHLFLRRRYLPGAISLHTLWAAGFTRAKIGSATFSGMLSTPDPGARFDTEKTRVVPKPVADSLS